MNEVAISAGNTFRAIDALVDELDRISPNNPRSIDLFDRFLVLHSDFYGYILTLTAEESWEVDEDLRSDVSNESQRLREIVQYLKKEKWFLEALTGKVVWRSNQMADYFARCVADIFEWYGIDAKTNEIFFIMD